MTDKQMAKVLDDMVIICDTREQRNEHILSYLEENKINYEICTLKSGDYSVKFPSFPMYDKCVIVEKKWKWDEIAGNFGKKREQFKNEFERIDENTLVHVVIEDATWGKLFKGQYRSQMPPMSILASILSWNLKYDINFWTIERKDSPHFIYNLLLYGVKHKLKGGD